MRRLPPRMLTDACLRFVGRELYVRPFYGWGWHRGQASVDNDDFERIESAGVFRIRVERLFSFRGELRGLVGVVTSEVHLFSGAHIVAAEMREGVHDFESNLCHRYDLELGSAAPAGPRIDGDGVVQGYGTIGASPAHIDAFLEEMFRR
jgi:hypothetical protein